MIYFILLITFIIISTVFTGIVLTIAGLFSIGLLTLLVLGNVVASFMSLVIFLSVIESAF